MNIKEIGGEFNLIDRLAKLIPSARAEVIKGIGDDAAVLRIAPEPAPYLVVTTDLLVDNHHFRRNWSTPCQVGVKAAECNLSDIAAMGGTPQWMFISLVLTAETQVEWLEEMYRGLSRSCQAHQVLLLGGDTTRGEQLAINITLLGWVAPDHLRLRSHAAPGDLLMVTGCLGASAAAVALLERDLQPSPYLLQKHLTPTARLDLSPRIAPLARAMIDISDGLGSEVRHICEQSRVGARIFADRVPIHDEVRAAARLLATDPLEWALSGGEDFELLFSIAPDKAAELEQSGLNLFQVGCIAEPAKGIILTGPGGENLPLPGGYDHFG